MHKKREKKSKMKDKKETDPNSLTLPVLNPNAKPQISVTKTSIGET
jgi:hypothetical protein